MTRFGDAAARSLHQAAIGRPERTPAPVSEFQFTERDFQRTRRLIRALAGIALADSKRQMVYARLARRLRALAVDDFGRYLDLVEGDKNEEQSFVNALTTNLTSFFRESHHFPVLADHLKRRSPEAPITIWCAAASTGEEPYSIAITALEALGDAAFRRVRIVASDLDTDVLEAGREGVYPIGSVDKLPAETLRRCFMRGTGSRDGFVRVKAPLRRMIEFRQINLLDDYWPIQSAVDAIFCRNVMIYFERPTQRRILERFVPLMTHDGLLFAGHSESLSHSLDLFRLQGKTVYQSARDRRTR